MLGSLPPLAILALMALNVITVPSALAVGFAAALLAVDLLAWRAVAAMSGRDRQAWMTGAGTCASVAGHPETRLSETRGGQQCPQH